MMMEEDDRLSDLPDSLIFDILGFFRTRDVMRVKRTTMLSKRWKNLWATIPFLDFNNVEMRMQSDKFRNLVNKALKSWRGNKIFRFGATFRLDDDNLLYYNVDDIDSWIRFAVEKQVEELYLKFPLVFCFFEKKPYLLPQDLYSCSSLKQLELSSCDLQVHGRVQWDQLESLKVWGRSLSQNDIDKVLCGSPRLECLSLLCLSKNNENLNISSGSLKRLLIDKCSLTDTEVRISTPNLEYLEISGYGYSKCLVMNNMPSLGVADLDFYRVPQDVVGETMTHILPVIKHVERVSLSDSCIEALGAMKEEGRVSSFPNANFLELRLVCCEEYERIVGVLEMFPQLRDLSLRTSERNRAKNTSFKLEKNAESFVPELRRVCVTCAKGDESIIPLVQILAKYARNLEKLVFWEEQVGETELLLNMERSSPDEELIFDLAKLRLQSGDSFYSGDYF